MISQSEPSLSDAPQKRGSGSGGSVMALRRVAQTNPLYPRLPFRPPPCCSLLRQEHSAQWNALGGPLHSIALRPAVAALFARPPPAPDQPWSMPDHVSSHVVALANDQIAYSTLPLYKEAKKAEKLKCLDARFVRLEVVKIFLKVFRFLSLFIYGGVCDGPKAGLLKSSGLSAHAGV